MRLIVPGLIILLLFLNMLFLSDLVRVQRQRLRVEEERLKVEQRRLEETEKLNESNLRYSIDSTCYYLANTSALFDELGNPVDKKHPRAKPTRSYFAELLFQYGVGEKYPCPYPEGYAGRVETMHGELVIELSEAKGKPYVSVRKPQQ